VDGEAVARSRSGLTTTIYIAVDRRELPSAIWAGLRRYRLAAMSTVLEALILQPWDGVREPIAAVGAGLVPLAVNGLALVPITDKVHEQIAGVPVVDESCGSVSRQEPVLGFYELTSGLAEWSRSLSRGGPIAYVNMEFFGGIGFHAAVAWRDGAICWGPRFTQSVAGEAEDYYEVLPGDMAINQVLRCFGVDRRDAIDEFAAAGLRRNRSTEEWASLAQSDRAAVVEDRNRF
jgi:hypothetical protein